MLIRAYMGLGLKAGWPERCLSLFWCFGMGTMLANFNMCGIMLLLRAAGIMLMRNAKPRGPMCFRCLMFSLSGPCELLFLLFFNAIEIDLKQFTTSLGVVVILLLNVMEVLSMGGGTLLDRPCIVFQRMCVLCL